MSTKWKTLLWSLLILLVAACTPATNSSQATDDAEIFAAVIRQIYTVDDTFGGTYQPSTLYIVRTLDDRVGDPETPQMEETRVLDEAITAVISDILRDLPTEIIWVDNRDEVPVNAQDGRVEGDGAIITLGNVQRQEDGTAQVPGSIYVASLAGGGQTYILEQVNGRWAVTGNTGTLWIS